MNELTGELQSWMAGGRFTQVDGVELFYHLSRQRGDHLPWLVCFHGFPTSSWDWHLLLPHLEKKYRILVFDFPGYGLSENRHRGTMRWGASWMRQRPC